MSTLVTQSRSASLIASLSVRDPSVTGMTSAPEQPHPRDVQRLAPGVDLAHVDDALEAEQRAGRGRRDAVLARAGLGDHPRLAHQLGEQRLAEHIVDLVRAGVVEVFALEQDPRAAGVLGQARRVGQRRRAAGVVALQAVQLAEELVVVAGLLVGGGQLVQGGDQRLRDEPAPVAAEVPAGVGLVAGRGGDAVAGLDRRPRARGHRTILEHDGWKPAATSPRTAARGSPLVTRPSPTSTASAPQPA